jgi:low temperature requirement protein LtrA
VERYGLFTIIVLGESILAATIGVQTTLDADGTFGELATVIVGGLLIVFSMWWIYFDLPEQRIVDTLRVRFDERLSAPFAWGYGHFLVFGSIAATGAGLAVAVDQATHHTLLTDLEASFCVTVPVALYLVMVWALHRRHKVENIAHDATVLAGIAAVLVSSLTPEPVLVTGLLLVALVAISVNRRWAVATVA